MNRHNYRADNGRLLRRRARTLLIGSVCLAVVPVLLLGTLPVRLLEKAVTALVLPCGLCWLALAGCGAIAAVRRQRLLAWLLAGIWLVYTLAGNGLIGHRLLVALEQPYYRLAPLDAEPHDQLVVLGGTVGYLENGEAQVSSGGDRVLLAARLYHRGKTRRLIAAGALMTPAGYDQAGAAKATAEIWQDLGVPAAAITPLAGRNTREEIRSLKALLEREKAAGPDPAAPRVGLVTSAWHMQRALRLARQEGLDLVPVPADFATSRQPPTWEQVLVGLIPSGNGFQQTDRAVKERLAGMVGR